MQVPELTVKLQRLGFAPEEATMYVRLLQNGPSRASTLSSLCDMNRTKVYRVLDDLVDDQYVSASVGRPTIFRAEDPEIVFEQLLQDLEARKRALTNVQKDALGPLKKLAGQNYEIEKPEWKLIEGSPRIYETLNRCLRDVEDEIVLVSNHPMTTTLVPFVEEAWEGAIEKAQKGVDFRVMLDMDTCQGDRVERWLTEPNVHVRDVSIEGTLHFVLLDNARVLQWLVTDHEASVQMEEGTAILSNAPGLVTSAHLLSQRLWDAAEPHKPRPGTP